MTIENNSTCRLEKVLNNLKHLLVGGVKANTSQRFIISPTKEMRDDAHKIGKQVFPVILRQVNDLKPPPLTAQQRFQVAKAKADSTVFVFHDNRAYPLIFEKCQKFRSVVV